jgi:hypothetical protein
MPSINEIANSGGVQTAAAALLKSGVSQISGDEHVTFNLYRKWVSPLDGMVYWVRALTGDARTALTGGLAHATLEDNRSIQVVSGGVGAADIIGGRIENPLSAADQGVFEAEAAHVNFTGPASASPDDGTTIELRPGEGVDIPPMPANGAWVSTPTGGHTFTVVVQRSVNISNLPVSINQAGSLHYASETKQEEDAVVDENAVEFTSKNEVQSFNGVGPDELYIGERDAIRFSFSSRGHYYEAADLWHYVGQSLISINKSLIIDDPVGWTPDLFVSNSLPIWLSFPGYVPPYWGLTCPFPLYPSFLAPDNAELPYGSVHIDNTVALQSAPMRGRHLERDQLSKDVVRVTLYGATAAQAADFMDFVLQIIRNDCKMGLMNAMPVIEDEKRNQTEFRILAQKKIVTFEVSYLQSVARDLARQVIKRALVQNEFNLYRSPAPPVVNPLDDPIEREAALVQY